MNDFVVRIRGHARWLHPGAWWLWALGLATAASRTTNPLLLLIIVGVACVVVAARKPATWWGKSFPLFLRLGVAIIVIRLVFQVLLGFPMGATVLLPFPEVPVPLGGLRLLGPATLEGLLYALYDGMKLATILICVGAANSLAAPTRLLKSLPAALYELGVSAIVALSFAPMLAADLTRVREARRLRGRTNKGLSSITGSAMPVLEGALDRSITLAAAMDSRGYGRRSSVSAGSARTASALLLVGLIGVCIGTYGLLDSSTPAILGVPLLLVGLGAAALGVYLAGRRSVRTRYRPDPWLAPEWAIAALGVLAAAAAIYCDITDSALMYPSTDPAVWPQIPLIAVAAVVLAASAGAISPPVPVAAHRVIYRRSKEPVA